MRWIDGLFTLQSLLEPLSGKRVGTLGNGNGDAVFTPAVNFGSIGISALTFVIVNIIQTSIGLRPDDSFAISHQFDIASQDDGNGFVYSTVDSIRERCFGFNRQFGNGFSVDFTGIGSKSSFSSLPFKGNFGTIILIFLIHVRGCPEARALFGDGHAPYL